MAEAEGNLQDTLDSVIGVAVRRRWWILPPTCLLAIASALALPYIPSTFTSDATVVVQQPQVSREYVTPVTEVSPTEVVRGLTRQVLSRPRLLRIVDELGLFPEAPRTDDLADQMREAIIVEPLDSRGIDYSSFRISFAAGSPQIAQAVTGRVASLFIEENSKAQGEKVESTASFLSTQVTEAKNKLDALEGQLRSRKINNVGQLPEEQPANLGAVTALRQQLQTALDNLNGARMRRDAIESVLTGTLNHLSAEKAELLTTRREAHPLVAEKDREITRTRTLLNRLHGVKGGAEAPSADLFEDASLVQLQAQVQSNAGEIATLQGAEQRLRSEIAEYEQRLKNTPGVDAQLSVIIRDRDQASAEYRDLVGKQNESQLTKNAEDDQQGLHFVLVDPASLPLLPSGPDARKILMGGLGAGLALGIGLALLVEMAGSSFHNEKELTQVHAAPLVIAVPMMLTFQERRSRRWRRTFEWLVAGTMLIAVVVVEVQAYLDRLSS